MKYLPKHLINLGFAKSAIFADFFLGGEGRAKSFGFTKQKRGREGSIESPQKFDFFSYDATPMYIHGYNSLYDNLVEASHGLNNNITASSYLRLSHVFIEDGKFTLAFPM